MIVHVFITYCLVLNPTQCRVLEIVPLETGRATSMTMCMRGLMSGTQGEFTLDGARWRIKGGQCKEVPMQIAKTQEYLKARITD
jgi:hypothetical protein